MTAFVPVCQKYNLEKIQDWLWTAFNSQGSGLNKVAKLWSEIRTIVLSLRHAIKPFHANVHFLYREIG